MIICNSQDLFRHLFLLSDKSVRCLFAHIKTKILTHQGSINFYQADDFGYNGIIDQEGEIYLSHLKKNQRIFPPLEIKTKHSSTLKQEKLKTLGEIGKKQYLIVLNS